MRVVILILALCAAAFASADRGFNSAIEWTSDLAAAIQRGKEETKPVFVLIHKTWCGACKRLKTVFADSAEILQKSKDFIMVNLEDDEEPAEEMYKPDGGYIPRIIMVDPASGEVMPVHNEQGNPQYKYYYASEDQILAVSIDL
jgi:protein-disulfide reductase (glutathione)